ncbi:hypothetical protein CN200_32120 [Sinorhizobium meliloti]|uniref:hypothetical protein n=1 Tax=Rhizobium meliloti TaxID=382 RepID=UPI000FD53578|nr:hypothetical protein [Sinorhizobium meliloti]RVI05000.1 hypothetical protein CN200_32120 [Sinorhizobium meliloti]RVN80880.1 hypothetical protein CN107_27895 [Sinorhizobium meliloti]RVN99883.1 hypothetical protein CN103_30435 [Sinorhizobium meliloti]
MTVHEVAAHIRAHGQLLPINSPLQAAILTTVGTGKTELMLRALAEFNLPLAEKRVHVFVPDNTLSGELLDRARAILPPEANARLHRGRKDEVLGDPPCHPSMHATVDLVEELGASASDLVCPNCPFADTCEWKAQTRDDAPGVVIMPHAYATLPAGGRCDVAVVDEDIVLSLHRLRAVLASRLNPAEYPKMPSGVRGWAAGNGMQLQACFDLHNAREMLWQASDSGTRVPTLPALRVAGLTPQLAKLAASIEYGRSEGINATLAVELGQGGDADEIRGRMATAIADYGDARKHAKLWKTLEAQLRLPEDARRTLNGWTIADAPNRHGGSDRLIIVNDRARLKFEDKPLLVLDATGDRRLLTLAFPHLSRVVRAAADAPHAHVVQAIDTKNGKRALVDQSTDSEEVKKEKAARRRRVVEVTEVLSAGRKAGLLSYLGVEESSEVGNAPPHILPGHYGRLRGQNKWADVHVLAVAGRVMPRAAEVESIAGGLFYDQPEAVGNGGFIGTAIGAYHMRNGETVEAHVETHSSPVVERVRRQITESELVQAIGRARSVRRGGDNPVVVAVLTSTPVPGLLVDELVTFDDLAPSKLELNFARSGVHLDRPQHAFRAFEGLFDGEEAARKAYKRMPSGTSPYKKFIKGSVPLGSVKYRLAGERQRSATATFDLSRIPDPRAWLTERLGPLAVFEMAETPVADVPLEVGADATPRAETLLAKILPAHQHAHIRALVAALPAETFGKVAPLDFKSWLRFAKKAGVVSPEELQKARTYWEGLAGQADRERRAIAQFLAKHPAVRALAALMADTPPPANRLLAGENAKPATSETAA